jgi:hypothetical protein
VRFTAEPAALGIVDRRIRGVNHAVRAFIQNKRYRTNPPEIGDVVNRNADSVYQTDAVLISIDRVQRRRSGAAEIIQ